jgi:uncharacterized protein RhaS with RHS repeats
MQRDPAGYVDGPNLYQYEGSNPVNRLDPSGLDFVGDFPWPGVGGDEFGDTFGDPSLPDSYGLTTSDEFLAHHLMGGGAVNLREAGLLGPWLNVVGDQVTKQTKSRLRTKAVQKARNLDCCRNSQTNDFNGQGSFSVFTPSGQWRYNVHDQVYALGGSSVSFKYGQGFVRLKCKNGEREGVAYGAIVRYELNDKFTNIFDIGGPYTSGYDIGSSFPIRANWSDSISGDI